jgi:hypothetical protein
MYKAVVLLVTKEPGLERLHELPVVEMFSIEFSSDEAMRGWLDTDPPGEPEWAQGVVEVKELS